MLFTPGSGDETGQLFLIVDGNGVAGYQAGFDLVIELSGAASIGSISTADFVA